MQSFRSADGSWEPMENGPAKSAWKPRKTAFEAAVKCLAWTGLVCIPAMQVVDLTTGEVVWRDSSQYPQSGASILPDWDVEARTTARRDLLSDDPQVGQEPVSQQLAFDFGALP